MFKYLVTALIVIVVSEFAKRNDQLGALMAAVPLVTVFTLVWLHIEGQSPEKIVNHSYYTFWYVLPTLPMFLVFPYLYSKLSFWPALIFSCLLTILLFGLLSLFMKRFSISLMG
ncbi:DUF3147 family protein [Methylovorus menthalis]|uniref:DUF3147 family protein n=1 Tax=Methylovorus menthalis TaxID=1002227 RepID=UPI002E1DF8E1